MRDRASGAQRSHAVGVDRADDAKGPLAPIAQCEQEFGLILDFDRDRVGRGVSVAMRSPTSMFSRSCREILVRARVPETSRLARGLDSRRLLNSGLPFMRAELNQALSREVFHQRLDHRVRDAQVHRAGPVGHLDLETDDDGHLVRGTICTSWGSTRPGDAERGAGSTPRPPGVLRPPGRGFVDQRFSIIVSGRCGMNSSVLVPPSRRSMIG